MNTKGIFRKTLIVAALSAAMGVTSTSAMAVFLDFQVTEGNLASTPLSGPNQFTADKVVGGYNEVITFGAGTFDASLRWNASDFFSNDGATSVGQSGGTQLNMSQLAAPLGYGLYALFQGSGTFVTNGGVTTFTTNPGGSLSVFTDPSQNTTFTAPATGAGAWATGNDADDILIATGAALAGEGTLDPTLSTCGGGGGQGINCGSFGTTTSFQLTQAGMTYFTAPDPFYNLSFQSGQLNNFTVAGTQQINGSLDVTFGSSAVPEPGTLALLGIAFAGLGFARRRQSEK